MNEAILHADGHGPDWAGAVADLADRAAAAFTQAGVLGCLSVVDLEPWRLLDAWWLRRRLEPLARLTGRPVRYIPCVGPGPVPRDQHIAAFAPAWSAGTTPVGLCWPTANERPHFTANGAPWVPDGPVLVLAGDLSRRLPQEMLLSHHGALHEWRGPPEAQKWHPLDTQRHTGWIADSLRAYTEALPSSMFSLPVGYWRFLEHATSWAWQGCLVVARAEGWSTLAEMRDETTRPARPNAEPPPVNFHWLAQHVSRIGASAHTVRAGRDDAVQVIACGLPDVEAVMPPLCAPLIAATRSSRTDRVRAVRALAAAGDLGAALSVLQHSADDPAVLRGAWEALTLAASSAAPAQSAPIGAWLERVMTDNPWIGEDTALLRAAGNLALACARPEIAHDALATLDELGRAIPTDLGVLARSLEQVGQLEVAVAACDRALARQPAQPAALATRARLAARIDTHAAPWRVQHGSADSPLLLDPLHADHAPMLARQMRDPSIADMTVLPALGEEDDGRAWIQSRMEDGIAAYAIVHRQLGFVGYLDLRVWQTTAFVCYWIGPDFQGRGLCAPAAALARELAFRNGIDLLLSSAFDDNARSLRALRRNGFECMDVRAMAPDHDRTFVMLPAHDMTPAQARQRLFDFCANTSSGLNFADATATATAPAAATAAAETNL